MLTSSPLPPRGVFVPTAMLFHSQLPSAVLLTWIQLRALAWKGWSTPPLSLAEFASILGIHPSRLEKHLDRLQSLSALSLRINASSKLVISFPELPPAAPNDQPKSTHLSTTLTTQSTPSDVPLPTSYFPRQILGYITYDERPQSPAESPVSETLPAESDKALIGLPHLRSLCTQDVV